MAAKPLCSINKSVKKGRQRRSRLLAAFGRTAKVALFEMREALTLFASCAHRYSLVRSARPSGCALPFGQTQGMVFEHSLIFL
jgi:hypothetical protein